MYKGIVFNSFQRDAFLTVAANEGLICENGMTDGVYRRMTSAQPSYQLVTKVFEQFVVAGRVYVDPVTYKYLDGILIEQEVIMPYEKANNVLDFHSYDTASVQRMMVDKGHDPDEYTEDRIYDIWYDFQDKARKCLDFENECGYTYDEIFMHNLLKAGVAENPKNQSRIDCYLHMRDEIARNPVLNVLAEYQELLNVAYHNDLLCPSAGTVNAKPKMLDSSDMVLNNRNALYHDDTVLDSDNAVSILRYTSDKLGRISVAGKLRDNVSLAQSEEAIAYRKKVDEWMMALSNCEQDNMLMIEEDIEKAQRAMKWKNSLEVVGKTVAVIGAASTALSWVDIMNPFMTVVATTMTYLGLYPAFKNPTKKYLWASFGLQK